MRVQTFDDVSIAMGCIASCLLCVSTSIRSDEKPQDDTIADAVYFLSTQTYDLEKVMDKLISDNLAEKRKLKGLDTEAKEQGRSAAAHSL